MHRPARSEVVVAVDRRDRTGPSGHCRRRFEDAEATPAEDGVGAGHVREHDPGHVRDERPGRVAQDLVRDPWRQPADPAYDGQVAGPAVDGPLGRAGAAPEAPDAGRGVQDRERVGAVVVPVARDGQVAGHAVGERCEIVAAHLLEEPIASQDGDVGAAVAVPVTGNRPIATCPEVDDPGGRAAVGALEVPGAAAEDRQGVGAVAVPVAEHRDVTALAVLHAVDRAAPTVAQQPRAVAPQADRVVPVAVEVAGDREVTGQPLGVRRGDARAEIAAQEPGVAAAQANPVVAEGGRGGRGERHQRRPRGCGSG